MARKATAKAGGAASKKSGKGTSGRSVVRAGNRGSSGSKDTAGEAFIKLLQSPLVADLLAVAATAALAALAEHGFNSSGADRRRARAGKAVKEAGKAAAAAIGRRLSNELEEIRSASKRAKGGAIA